MSAPLPWTVRPLPAGDVITDALRLMRSDFWKLCGTVAVVVVPANLVIAVILYLFMRHMGRVPYSEPNVAALGVLYYGALLLGAASLWGLVIPFAQVALMRAITDRYMGLPVSIGRSYRWLVDHFWTVTGTVVLVALVLAAVLTFIVIPGFFAVVLVAVLAGGPLALVVLTVGGIAVSTPLVVALFAVMLAVPTMVTEGEGGVYAVARSVRLVFSQPTKLLLLVSITWLMSLAVSSLPGLFIPTPDVDLTGPTGIFDYYGAAALTTAITTALAGLTQSVIRTLRGSVYLMCYFDARCRTEGYDVEFAARKAGIWAGSAAVEGAAGAG
jgi:hypothetical protein